ncbi:nuclease harbi1-like protein [Lasius niger]|uniref:Nuclease harbi1-like protein n=1 Tax=Lasius niger TaxID=67767 RepID=A0A0J7KF15_LASNI|nr:nuclease harbi1-like protein [Lasius niger]
MRPDTFDRLLELISPFLIKKSIRKPLPLQLRLALTLSYLAHGDSVSSKSWDFRIGRSTVHKIIPECGWQTHQNQGTISVGTNYFCYKKFFSLVLMAACDADYRFVWMDIGQYGSLNDCSIWTNCDFGRMLENGEVELSPPKCLPSTNILMQHAFVDDKAFPLKQYMIKPFSKRQLGDAEQSPVTGTESYRKCFRHFSVSLADSF